MKQFVRVEEMIGKMSGGHFMVTRALEQLLYGVMVGEGNGFYHVLVGDDRTTYVQEYMALLCKLSVSPFYLNYDKMSVGKQLLVDEVRLVIGTGTRAVTMSEADEVVLKYLVDGEPMYVEPMFPYESGHTLSFNGVVAQKGTEEFLQNLGEGLKRRATVLRFGYVENKEELVIDDELVAELRLYLQARYE